MRLTMHRVSADDGKDVYLFLQQLPYDENGFINSVAGMTYDEYQLWLKGAADACRQEGIVDGWKVPQSIYWLFLDEQPIGYGKVRHFLTESLRDAGGHIGLSIHPAFRGRGYGKTFLAMLIEECRTLGIEALLCTIRNENRASIQMALACGGVLDRVTDKRHYITIQL